MLIHYKFTKTIFSIEIIYAKITKPNIMLTNAFLNSLLKIQSQLYPILIFKIYPKS